MLHQDFVPSMEEAIEQLHIMGGQAGFAYVEALGRAHDARDSSGTPEPASQQSLHNLNEALLDLVFISDTLSRARSDVARDPVARCFATAQELLAETGSELNFTRLFVKTDKKDKREIYDEMRKRVVEKRDERTKYISDAQCVAIGQITLDRNTIEVK